MLAVGLFVDSINGIDYRYYILYGYGFVCAQYYACLMVSGFNTCRDSWLKVVDHNWSVVDLILHLLVDINRYALLGHSLAVAFGEHQLHGVGTDERGGYHKEDE